MYQKPTVERLGSFRDLTQTGGTTYNGDGFSILSAAAPSPTVSTTVTRS